MKKQCNLIKLVLSVVLSVTALVGALHTTLFSNLVPEEDLLRSFMVFALWFLRDQVFSKQVICLLPVTNGIERLFLRILLAGIPGIAEWLYVKKRGSKDNTKEIACSKNEFGVVLNYERVQISLFLWLMAAVLLVAAFVVNFSPLARAFVLGTSTVLFISRVNTAAAFSVAFRRSLTKPRMLLWFVLYLLLPIAEHQYSTRNCDKTISVVPFWVKTPAISNMLVADIISETSPYTATAQNKDSAITIVAPSLGTFTAIISKRHYYELYLFVLSSDDDCRITADTPLPESWSREWFADEHASEYSVECELPYRPLAKEGELATLITSTINQLELAVDKGAANDK